MLILKVAKIERLNVFHDLNKIFQGFEINDLLKIPHKYTLIFFEYKLKSCNITTKPNKIAKLRQIEAKTEK